MVDDKLKYIFSTVNEWLKFAEAKNAALLIFNNAIAFGLLNILDKNYITSQYIRYYLYLSLCFLVLSIVISLLSFIPKIKIPSISQSEKSSGKDNMIFFSHIAKHSTKEYLNLLYGQHNETYDKENLFQENLTEQIIVNSQIALSKYRFFEIGIWFTLAGIVSPVIALIVFIITKHCEVKR